MDGSVSSRLRDVRFVADLLREQDATPAQIAEWAPVVRRLSEWPEPDLTPADTERLLSALAPLVRIGPLSDCESEHTDNHTIKGIDSQCKTE